MLKISIITVSYNSGSTIEDTIKSVANQRYPNIEYIIVDGLSTDNTLEIVRRYPNIVTKIISEIDGGIYDAMNKGIALCTGGIIGLINSDDILADDSVLQRVSDVFANDPAIDACYGDLCYVKCDDLSKVVRYWRSNAYQRGLFKKGWVAPHPTLYVRNNIYEKYGGFDLRYPIAADFELILRLFEVNHIKTAYIPHVLVKMRIGGTSSKDLKTIYIQNREIWQALRSHNANSSFMTFAAFKFWSRILQLLKRPK
jgi:glycosyltransferase involved in cell wall biosynthesis